MLRPLWTKLVLVLIAALSGAVLLTIMLVYGTLAVYLGLSDLLPPALAALSTAGAAILLLLIILLILKGAGAAARNRRPRGGSMLEMMFNAGKQMGSNSRGGPAMTLIGLFAIGFALGASPKLRSLLLKLI